MAKDSPSAAHASADEEGPLAASIAARSDVGRSRSNNEDSFVVFDLGRRLALEPQAAARVSLASPGVLLAVADGMGGHRSGQVASQHCVERLPAELLKTLPEEAAPEWDEGLTQAILATSHSIYQEAQQNPDWAGMGTTLTAACLAGQEAVIAQVGDSRAYLFRQGSLNQLTRDQTVLSSLSPSDREVLAHSPLDSMLLQAVGAMADLQVVVGTFPLAVGDLLLLCSDGLYRVLSNKRMAEILQLPEPVEKKVEALVAQANAGGGPDNITVILCEILGADAD